MYYRLVDQRQRDMKQKLQNEPTIKNIETAGEFLPPSKPPEYSPYDMVLTLEPDSPTDIQSLTTILQEHELEYDRIIHIGMHEGMKELVAYISLAEFNPEPSTKLAT